MHAFSRWSRSLLAICFLFPHANNPLAQEPTSAGLSTVDREGILSAHDAWARSLRPHGDGYRSTIPSQDWSITLDERGFELAPADEDWSWGLELVSFGTETAQSTPSQTPDLRADGTTLQRSWGSGVLEWYDNRPEGFEHGFDIAERLATTDTSPLALQLKIRGNLSPELSPDGRDVFFRTEDGIQALGYRHLLVTDATGEELPARFEVRGDGLRLLVEDRDAQYPIHVDPIAQGAYLKASNTNAKARFGSAIAISGDRVAIGAPSERSDSTGINGDPFNNRAVNAGAVYIFLRTASGWVQEAYIKASNTDAGDRFGTSVDFDGDRLVVGAPGEDSASPRVNGAQANNQRESAGAAYVFTRASGSWLQEAYLKPSVTGRGDEFGESVAIRGATIAVGAPREDSKSATAGPLDNGAPESGAAYVFARNGGLWFQQAYLKASNAGFNDVFGSVVDLDAGRLLVGAPGESSDGTSPLNNTATRSGAAYVFDRSLSSWSETAFLKASNTDRGDLFGSAVAVLGDTLVVGAPGESGSGTGTNADPRDNGAAGAGAAYVFDRSGGFWSESAYLKATNTDPLDFFGRSVALGTDALLVGAPTEDGSGTGLDPQDDDASLDSGAAYLFLRDRGSWMSAAYLKASNTGTGDAFGDALALSDSLAVIGAPLEASSARGVGGNEEDDRAPEAGAGYVFDLPPFLFAQTQSRHGVPRNPDVFQALSRPVIGQDFRSAVDHSSFAPSGTMDILLATLGLPVNLPGPHGTVLVDLTAPYRLLFAPAGGVFSVHIPDDCSLIGLVLRAQVASITPGSRYLLTNALDITIGSF
ncbi:MAG TPA: hypothetical protein ENJ09_15890 [Planctomycetes bacterium]|nr:hypothetical protein [Planctomycetota bacterium]